jgi:hypothetical protein
MKIRRTAQRPPSKTINEGAECYRVELSRAMGPSHARQRLAGGYSHVCLGSLAAVTASIRGVRFAPEAAAANDRRVR